MAKRQASEALEELLDIGSPASKRSRIGDLDSPFTNGIDDEPTPNAQSQSMEQDDESDDNFEDEIQPTAPLRQSAPTDGYGDLYLDTIDRSVLDFDFEKLCSVSLSNINVYACLVCGKYFQGRGPKSHAYFHALDEDHHVYINLESQKVYVLPEGYEVKGASLDDIKYVADPRYTKAEVYALDKVPRESRTLSGKSYTPGFVGMNNIKENDYLNVVVQGLSHTSSLRNFFLLEDFSKNSELVKRCSILFRKIWNPRAFKAHVSPHELLQEIALRSNKRFTLTHQSDPADFFTWFVNNLHTGLGGAMNKPGSSFAWRSFQGKMKVESQAITARANPGDRLRFEESTEIKTEVKRFIVLPLDLPAAPLFQDEQAKNIIPQVPLPNILNKYDGQRTQEQHAERKRYRLMHPLPPYLVFHVKRFSQNKFVSERNPTIVTFDTTKLNMAPYVEPSPEHPPGEEILYDLVANVVHEAVRTRDDVSDTGEEKKTWKVQLKDKATGEWAVCQDLYVDKVQQEMLYLGETYLQIWQKRPKEKKKQGGDGEAV